MAPICLPVGSLSPVEGLCALAGLPGLCFLDSAMVHPETGRFSFLMADPFEVFRGGDGDPWNELRSMLAAYPMPADPDPQAPPFRGGAAGFFTYELARTLYPGLPFPDDHTAWPDLAVGFYDVVVVFNHQKQTAWLYSSGYPAREESARKAHAQNRAEIFLGLLQRGSHTAPSDFTPLNRALWQSNFDEESYRQAVGRVRSYIRAGDIFQANISQRFTASLPDNWEDLAFYLRLRAVNPAPFGALVRLEGGVVASASPERFVRLSGRHAETRPIKGTRPRYPDPGKDREMAEALLASEKDRAENLMIVDLLRNDLSRVCMPGSVRVPAPCALESYAGVHHLVSVVEGRLEPGHDALDLLKACFPGGSVTGAPKRRSMEIIAELEGIPRHVYCGALGYIGFDGSMDTCIPIRTLLIRGGQVSFQVGGGITWLSDPGEEYRETMDKARKIFMACGDGLGD